MSQARAAVTEHGPAAPASGLLPVTADNFIRAETDRYLESIARGRAFGRFLHHRDFPPVDRISVVRVNRDTLYSVAVFDLDAGPVVVTLPDPGERYLSLTWVNQDHFADASCRPGPHTFSREQVGTRYVVLGVRVLVDPARPGDRQRANALQDAIEVRQPEGGRIEFPAWDKAGLDRIRAALLVLGEGLPDSRGMFGARGEVDPVRHLIGTALAWGGLPEREALYLNVTPSRNDGVTPHRLRVKEVPVDAFWSVTVYDEAGGFRPHPSGVYSINSLTASREADGSVDILFDAGDAVAPNRLPIMAGWNYMVRLYRPRPEVLEGRWEFPRAEPLSPVR